MAKAQRTPIYISASGKDPYWRSKLVAALEPFNLELLYDTYATPTDEWKPDLGEMREKARIAVLLVSQNFIDSKRILSEELPHLFHLRKNRGLQLIVVVIGQSNWQTIPELREIQVFPEDGIPLQRGMEARISIQMQALSLKILELANSLGDTPDSDPADTASTAITTIVPPTITKTFDAASIALWGDTKLTFKIANPNKRATLTEVTFLDPLPSGLVVSSPNGLVGSWAGGNLSAEPGSEVITFSDGVLPSGESCSFQLSITGISSGRKNNTTSSVSSKEGGPGGSASASLLVFPAAPEATPPSEQMTDPGLGDLFSQEVRLLFDRANQLRKERQGEMVSLADVIRALAENKNGQLAALLAESKAELESIIRKALQRSARSIDGAPILYVAGIPVSENVHKAINIARDKAKETGSPVKEEHMLYGMLSTTRSSTVQALNALGITPDKVKLTSMTESAAKAALAQAGYKSDDPTGEDLLDIAKDVKVLATVLAAKDVDPPLSLGLFGDWGTGKSFFMHELEARIRELTDDAKVAKGESDYCQDIVQLTFNAWNYIEEDLWASLAAEIFEGLAGALASKRDGDSKEGRALALAAASSSPAIVAETERQKSEAEARLQEYEKKLVELQRSQSTVNPSLSAREVLNQAARFAVQDEDLRKQAKEAATEVGIPKGLANDILELGSIWSKIVFAIRSNGLWPWIAACSIAMSLGWAVMNVAKHSVSSDLVRRIVAVLVAVSGLMGTLLTASRKILTFIFKIRAAKQQLVEKTLEAIKGKIDRARESVQEAAKDVKTLTKQLEDMRSDRQMVDFIRQRYESSDYREHLGTIARVRADFKHLSALLRDVQRESENEINEIKRRQAQKEEERKQKDGNASPLFPRIDRIILYIDDLDRCQEKQVVQVLQAVHLLLAFPLFVVVVGVDPRWLLHSLQQHTAVLKGDKKQNEEPGGHEEPSHWESTPANYLEKIFQIPFTLHPIRKSGFTRLVDTFAVQSKRATDSIKSIDSQLQPQHVDKAAASQVSPLPVSVSQRDLPSVLPLPGYASGVAAAPALEKSRVPAGEKLKQQESSAQTVMPPAGDPIDRYPEHLRIEEWEREFMKTLYELIPSPRAGKRFINIYRLLRATVEDREREGFIGNDAGGEYQCALLLLAVLTGYPTEATETLEALLKEQSKDKTWKQFLNALREKICGEKRTELSSFVPEGSTQSRGPTELKERSIALPDIGRWEELFTKLERINSNLDERSCEGFIRWAPRVARYSFQSGRVLLHQRE